MNVKQWEYYITTGRKPCYEKDTLDGLGLGGWELVSVIGDNDYYQYVCKKPIIKEVEGE